MIDRLIKSLIDNNTHTTHTITIAFLGVQMHVDHAPSGGQSGYVQGSTNATGLVYEPYTFV